ncbi:hypothetical protein D043_4970B, partial [Vibrio parahaemolyticus EKP-021]
YPEKLT